MSEREFQKMREALYKAYNALIQMEPSGDKKQDTEFALAALKEYSRDLQKDSEFLETYVGDKKHLKIIDKYIGRFKSTSARYLEDLIKEISKNNGRLAQSI